MGVSVYQGNVVTLSDTQTLTNKTLTSPTITTPTIATINNTAGVDIQGTNTNDSASAGYVGEYMQALGADVAAPTSGQYKALTSAITLTAGDWDISALCRVEGNGATITGVIDFGVGTATGNNSTGMNGGENATGVPIPASDGWSGACIPSYRVSLTGSQTYYAKIYMVYSVAVPNIQARISARRVR